MVALLSIRGAAGKHGLSRDKLIAYLWPESNTEHGRILLKQPPCTAGDLHAPELFCWASELHNSKTGYNRAWLLERHGYRTPAEVRRALTRQAA